MIIQQAWIAAAQASHKAFYPRGPFASITLAQFGLESAWGTRASGRNNYFGIKATNAQIAAGDVSMVKTWEQRPDGSKYTLEAYFANYANLADGFTAHAYLLCQPWYKDCIAATTSKDYAYALLKDHYATAFNYADVLIGIIDQYDLTQYDVLN
jgi:flagellum-specific peptidoglycan hydrolase FlgJ